MYDHRQPPGAHPYDGRMHPYVITVALAVAALVSCGGAEEPMAVTAPPIEATNAPSTTATPELARPATPTTSSRPEPPNTSAVTTAGSIEVAPESSTVASTTSESTTSIVVPAMSESPTSVVAPGTSELPTTTLGRLRSLAYVEVATVDYPIDLAPVPGTDLLAIASKEGRIWLHGPDGLQPEPLLDIRELVRNRGEQGLLGMAFAPDSMATGRLFLHYSDLDGATVLSEYIVDPEPLRAGSGTVLLRIQQPASNHNGGTILFGPDGYLYVGLGDGGRANDAFGHGQNDRSVLGALLRFDASVPGVLTPAPGNPYPEPSVWAIGLRNPWRFAIDRMSGLLVIADVGQNHFEEISVAPFDEPGLNYGWPITEGLHCFRPSSGCDAAGLTLPVLEIEHGDGGTCSITGGVVYRGSAIPEMYGHYLFSDYCGGYLRSFPIENPEAPGVDWTDQVGNAGQVVSFGTDAAGEVYVLTEEGSVLRLEADRG